MKKALLLTLLALSIAVTPVVAAPPEHSNAKVNENAHRENPGKEKSQDVRKDDENKPEIEVEQVEEESTPTPTPDDETEPEQDVLGITSAADEACPPDAEWKNHGKYVSCVAKQKLGGKVVSEAARSEIGKKNNGEASPSATPTVTPTPTGDPITSPISEVDEGTSPLSILGDMLDDLVSFVTNLI